MTDLQSTLPSVVPAYRKPADRRTEIAGFRIYRDQNSKLSNAYKGKSSKLIRILLDKYFKGDLPDVEMELNLND